MIKCDLLETLQLEKSFRSFRQGKNSPARGAKAAGGDDNNIHAPDLVAALDVSLREAEEMIFIADIFGGGSIDFTEFKQVVVNWSG